MKIRKRTTDWRKYRELYRPEWESAPYLSWVPSHLRAQTINPADLPVPRSTKRRRILVLSSSYMTGGAEVFAVNVARLLAPRHEVYLWTQKPGDYSIQGILPLYDGDPVLLAKAIGADLVIYNNGAAFWYERRFKVETRCKTILCLHGLVKWTADQFRGHVQDIDSIDAFWAFSSVAGGLRHMGFRRPAYQLHCPVDDARFPFVARTWRPPYRIGYIGRVSVEKNLCALVDLWSRLHSIMGEDVRFDFIGGLDPTNRDPEYLAWLGPVVAKAKGMPEWKRLMRAGVLTDHGQCSRDRVRELLRNLHVLTLTSDFEGEPVVFTEAMASGALCSFRRVGEVDKQLDGVGLLTIPHGRKVTDAELDEMAGSIAETLRRPAVCRRMVRDARKRYEQRHAPAAWVANFERMMEAVLDA